MTKKTRRDEIFEYIVQYAKQHRGPSPTIYEIARHMGKSYSTTYRHVMRLIEEERLEQLDGKLSIPTAFWIERPSPYEEKIEAISEDERKRLFMGMWDYEFTPHDIPLDHKPLSPVEVIEGALLSLEGRGIGPEGTWTNPTAVHLIDMPENIRNYWINKMFKQAEDEGLYEDDSEGD